MSLGTRYRERSLGETKEGSNVPLDPIPTPLGVFREYSSGAVVNTVYLNNTGTGYIPRFQRTWDQVNPGPPYLSGGPFSSLRALYPIQEAQGAGTHSRTIGSTKYEYSGGFYLPDLSNDPISPSSIANMGWGSGQDSTLLPDPEATYGPEVFGRLRPQLSDGGLGVAVAELRDLPGMLKTSAQGFHEIWKSMGGHPTSPFMQPKKVADHFLNHEFGWVPFLADVGKFADNFKHGRVKLDNLTKNNDKWIKRERVLHDELVDWNIIHSQEGFIGCQPNGYYMSLIFPYVRTDIYSRLVDRVWAEGRFRYYRPELDRSLSSYDDAWPAMQRQMLLHGARINPSVLWRATPWTWLIDWGVGVGKFIDNMEAIGLDGVVSKYLYLMQHKQQELASVIYLVGSDQGTQALQWHRKLESKQRVESGNPFGFGLQLGNMSPMKLAILAALGISRT